MPNVKVAKKKKQISDGLHVVKCECGVEILMVPDVKLMGDAIEAHAELHRRKVKNPEKAESEAERIRDCLTAQVLEKAADSGQ